MECNAVLKLHVFYTEGVLYSSPVHLTAPTTAPPPPHTRGQRRGPKRTRDTSPPAATGCVSVSCVRVRRANFPPGPQPTWLGIPSWIAPNGRSKRRFPNPHLVLLSTLSSPSNNSLLLSACSTSKHHRIRGRVGTASGRRESHVSAPRWSRSSASQRGAAAVEKPAEPAASA